MLPVCPHRVEGALCPTYIAYKLYANLYFVASPRVLFRSSYFILLGQFL